MISLIIIIIASNQDSKDALQLGVLMFFFTIFFGWLLLGNKLTIDTKETSIKPVVIRDTINQELIISYQELLRSVKEARYYNSNLDSIKVILIENKNMYGSTVSKDFKIE